MEAAKGYAFTDGLLSDCNEANLEALVNSAIFSNMKRGDFISTERPIVVSGTQPSAPPAGELWLNPSYNTGANPVHILFFFDGTNFIPVATGLRIKATGATNIDAGDTVRGGDPKVDPFPGSRSSVANDNLIIGIAVEDIVVGQTGFVITKGYAVANVLGTPINWGAMVSTVTGVCNASSRVAQVGTFGRIVDATNKIAYVHGIIQGS